MMASKRLLALAGCALVLTACTQETTTAPPASADVGIEALPENFGFETGTLTLVRTNDFTIACYLKVSLKGLYDYPDVTNDMYELYAGVDPIGSFSLVADVSRGTYRGQFYFLKTWRSRTIYLRYYADGAWRGVYTIGQMDPLFVDPSEAGDFKLVNRCP